MLVPRKWTPMGCDVDTALIADLATNRNLCRERSLWKVSSPTTWDT